MAPIEKDVEKRLAFSAEETRPFCQLNPEAGMTPVTDLCINTFRLHESSLDDMTRSIVIPNPFFLHHVVSVRDIVLNHLLLSENIWT